ENGKDEHPIFTYLQEQAPTEEVKGLKAKAAAAMFNKISKSVEKDSDIKWNFTKFLISRDGTRIERFAPTTEPKNIEAAIEAML
ncbi:MAG: glutathione peroxidase, partial [Bacteroidales bacterium]|nr:glutathione peroxidase [Bacteroidales bacterium]